MRARLLALGVKLNRRLERQLLERTGDWAEGQRKRFWKLVKPYKNGKCWKWLGSINKNSRANHGLGYAKFHMEPKHSRLNAHRISYILTKKRAIPAGMFACHSCDNPACVNPKHIWIGTNRDNQMDASKKGRSAKPFGELQANSKLNKSQVLKMREMANKGICQRRISEKFGISFQHVNKIIHRMRWAHI